MTTAERNRKGFTLVEVIVVLVILAILAAIMIPAMTGWIDKANEKKLVVECRTCVTAAQTIASEKYGKLGAGGVSVTPDETLALAEVPGTVSGIAIDGATAAVDTLTYTDEKGRLVTYLRLPSPHYEFGGGNASGSITGIENAFDKMQTVGGGKDVWDGKPFVGAKIDGVNSNTPGNFANAMYQTFTPEQQAYLDSISWSIVRDGNKTGDPYYLYITDKHYDATQNASDVKVYKYDLVNKTYQSTSTGTKITNGMVTANGTNWSEPSATME